MIKVSPIIGHINPKSKFFSCFFLYVLQNHELKILCEVGNSIRKLRIKRNISQAQLAFEIKTDGRHIRRIEKGEVNVSFITLIRIAEVLDCCVCDLIKK